MKARKGFFRIPYSDTLAPNLPSHSTPERDIIMSRHSRRISSFLICILLLLCVPPLISAQNVGTVRLREERPIFQDYAVFEPNSKQYVRVICQTGDHAPPAKPTIELVYPLLK